MIDRVITETFQICYTGIYACNILRGREESQETKKFSEN